MPTFKPLEYYFSPSLSSTGTFLADGFSSRLERADGYSSIIINLSSSVQSTINIYKSNQKEEDNKVLFFSKTINADEKFFRAFPLQTFFIQVEILNDTSTEGTINLTSAYSSSPIFNSIGFINSTVYEEDIAVLSRITNDFSNDVVRGLNNNITQVEIQGFSNQIQSIEHTIGLDNDFQMLTASDATLEIQSADDNQPSGIGAHTVLIDSVLDTGATNSSTFNVNTGSGLTGVNMKAVNQLSISTAGSSLKNQGKIIVKNGSTMLCQIQANENKSRCAVYLVPNNKQLILNEIEITGRASGGQVIVYELKSSGIQNPIGQFEIDIGNVSQKLKLNRKIVAGDAVKVNYKPTITTGDLYLSTNLHAVQYPTNNSF